MTREEIEEKVRKFLIEDMEVDEENIYADANLKEDMDIDSLAFIDIVVLVERIFGFRIKMEEMKDVQTFSQFCDYIEKKIA